MEHLTGDKTLSKKLRLPAQSRLQKLHNIGCSLTAFKALSGCSETVQARHIVEGNLEHTLGLIWQIIATVQLEKVLDLGRLQDEVEELRASLAASTSKEALKGLDFVLECQRRDLKMEKNDKELMSSESLQLILQWVRMVCAHYGHEVIVILIYSLYSTGMTVLIS